MESKVHSRPDGLQRQFHSALMIDTGKQPIVPVAEPRSVSIKRAALRAEVSGVKECPRET
jgi:hypothetical protein